MSAVINDGEREVSSSTVHARLLLRLEILVRGVPRPQRLGVEGSLVLPVELEGPGFVSEVVAAANRDRECDRCERERTNMKSALPA